MISRSLVTLLALSSALAPSSGHVLEEPLPRPMLDSEKREIAKLRAQLAAEQNGPAPEEKTPHKADPKRKARRKAARAARRANRR